MLGLWSGFLTAIRDAITITRNIGIETAQD